MAAVRQLAGERKGLGSGAQSARQANSLLANLQAAGVDRAALAAAAAAAAAAIRVVGAVAAAAALAVGPRAPGAPRPPAPMVRGRTIEAAAARRRRPRARRCGALAALARSLRRRRLSGSWRKRAEQGAEVRISGASCWCGVVPSLKAPQRDVRATTRRHSAAVCPRDGPANPIARPRANNILSIRRVRRIILAPQRRARRSRTGRRGLASPAARRLGRVSDGGAAPFARRRPAAGRGGR